MINNLNVDVEDVLAWKYVDDTTIAETVPRGLPGNAQISVSVVEDWSRAHNMQLNADKCKELTIDFKKNTHVFAPLTIEGKELPVVNSAKILGLTISNDLKWNDHISECIKKANKRLYFIVSLRRARVPTQDIIDFYCSAIRPVLEYCAPVFHHALPSYLSDDIERVQKRIMSIVTPNSSYLDSLTNAGLVTLMDRRNNLCSKLFSAISNDPNHKLHSLLPPLNGSTYNFRRPRTYRLPHFKTNRHKRSFIPAMCCL